MFLGIHQTEVIVISCYSLNSCVEVCVFSLTLHSYPDSGRSSTFRRMCALPCIAVFASWGILFFPGISWRCFSRLLLVALRAPITIGSTLALMFHFLCMSNLRPWYFSIFSLSFSTMCVSFGIATSIMSPSFVCLSITTKSGLRACICLSVLISKSHNTLTLLLSATELGLWNQMLSVVLISQCWQYAVVDCCCYKARITTVFITKRELLNNKARITTVFTEKKENL